VHRLRYVVEQLMHKDVMQEFGGISNEGVAKRESWNRYLTRIYRLHAHQHARRSKVY